MREIIMLKYGEIILKGLNRPVFERLLMKNIRKRLGEDIALMECRQAVVYIEPSEYADVEEMTERLKKVFGIVSIMRAAWVEKSMDAILSVLPEYLRESLADKKTFKVEAKRSDKTFPLKSPEICRECGGKILESFHHLRVDVKEPDVVVWVEIREKGAYIHAGRMDGAGGMPVGSNGRAALLLSGGIDSPVAGYMLAKRGVELSAVHFESPPYTSEAARDKVLELAKRVSEYAGPIRVHIVPFTEQQLAIRDNCPEEHLTLIMRRMMMMAAERIARRDRCVALITGESLGQVASQTIHALAVTNEVAGMPVFRPLIGMDKDEIVTVARRIDTFETSILPYEDCCTVFVPKHPTTKPKLEQVMHSEEALDMEGLVQKSVDEAVTVTVGEE